MKLIREFNIKDPAYFRDALHDAIGLYSLLSWRYKQYTSYKDGNPADYIIIEGDNPEFIDPADDNDKIIKVNSTQTSKYSGTKYKYIDTFFKHAKRIKALNGLHPVIEFKCQIFKLIDNHENNAGSYIVNFKWGEARQIYDDYEEALVSLYEFIINNTTPGCKIMLCGYSMGATIAQLIAIQFLKSSANQALNRDVYLSSIGMGGTVSEAQKLYLEKQLDGKYISFCIELPNPPANFDYDKNSKDMINDFIYPRLDSPGTHTIKSAIISFGLKLTLSDTRQKIISEEYDLLALRTVNIFKEKSDVSKTPKLHDFLYYKQIIHMILSGKTKERVEVEKYV